MRRLMVLVAASGFSVLGQSQSLDLSSLDKLAAKAKEVNKVSLTKDQLQSAMKLIPQNDDDDSETPKKLMHGLESVQVRNYEFAKAGEYTDADLDSVRAQMTKMRGCSAIVDSKEEKEHSQIFMCSEGGKNTGLAVIDSEPKEISVVFVKGDMNFSDLGKLNGLMGVPRMGLNAEPKPPVPPTPAKKGD